MNHVRSRARFTVRRLMVAVAVVGLLFGLYDQARVLLLSNTYRRKAVYCDRMERRCREIDAMDPAVRTREAAEALDDPFLDDPAWNKRMIPYFKALQKKYEDAASHPRLPVAPDPPAL
jgi:hypothetical protein